MLSAQVIGYFEQEVSRAAGGGESLHCYLPQFAAKNIHFVLPNDRSGCLFQSNRSKKIC